MNLIIPIQSDHKKHWVENRISFIYKLNLETFTYSIINFHHNDGLICPTNDYLNEGDVVYRKKTIVDCRAKYDVEMVYWYFTNERFEVQVPFTIRSYWNDFSWDENVNDFIPIMKWIEYCNEIKEKFLLKMNLYNFDDLGLEKYHQMLQNLAIIEKNGLLVK